MIRSRLHDAACRLPGVDRWRARKYLRRSGVRKLHLGCGANLLPGWLNTDRDPVRPSVARLDVTRPFPFPDASFDRIFNEHMIEHVPYREGVRMLSECQRVLVPGGRIRISTPDLAFLLALFRSDRSELQTRYIAWSLDTFVPDAPFHHETFVLNNFVRNWGHQFVYDENLLRDALARAGFVEIIRCGLGKSADLELRDLENEKRLPPGMLELETLVLEATKPGGPLGATGRGTTAGTSEQERGG